MTALMSIQTKSPPAEDFTLARQARTDAEAFAELYRRHVTRVYRYHIAHTGNVKDAEDLTSQTFMAALEGIRSFRGSGSFAAWIMGIASRKRASFFRGHKPEVPLDDALHIPTPGLPTDKAAAQRLRLDHIRNALKKITPERAEALILCYFGGLNAAEAGRVLGKTESAVKMLLSRGLHDLRERTSLALEVEYE
jgi:RNA polymerase sigma-70 factor (ECF subfamily)